MVAFIIFFFIPVSCTALLHLNINQANECRRLALLGRTRWYRCYIASYSGTARKKWFFHGGMRVYDNVWRNDILDKSIDKEWKWVLDPKSVSSQVFVRKNKNAFFMLSLKQCGVTKSGGVPIRRIYNRAGRDYEIIRGKSNVSVKMDVYSQCVRSTENWRNFDSNGNNSKLNSYFITDQIKDSKKELHAVRYDTEYSVEDIYSQFNIFLDGKLPKPSFSYGKPIVLNEYPYDKGLTLLLRTSEFNASKEKFKPLFFESSHERLAWNYAQYELFASTRYPKPDSGWNKLDFFDIQGLIGSIVIHFIGILDAFRQYRMGHREKLKELRRRSTSEAFIVSSQGEYERNIQVNDEDEEFCNVVNIIAESLLVILGPLGYFVWVKDFYTETLFEVHQGGVISYGNQKEVFTGNNSVHGEFSVAHWIYSETKSGGNQVLYWSFVYVFVLACIFEFRIIYNMAMKRDHQLDSHFLRLLSKPFLRLGTILFPKSYKRKFHSNLERVSRKFGSNQNYGTINSVISIQQAEKATAVLTYDELGLLNYAQVLAITMDSSLRSAAENHRSKGEVPTDSQIKTLALLYSAHHAVIGDIERINADGDLQDITSVMNVYDPILDSADNGLLESSCLVPEINLVEEADSFMIRRVGIMSVGSCHICSKKNILV